MKKYSILCLMLAVCLALSARTYKVSNISEYNAAVKKTVPGDSIVLRNQVWQDVRLVFKGQGTEQQSITLTVETPGQCTIEGQSNLRISGSYLVVDGLVFVNGYTPSSKVIEFKTSDTEAARYCTLKRCVVDTFNNPEKTQSDNWVNLCGQYNKVEYCYFGGKKNLGTTFIVSPDGEGHAQNFHHIYRNYFGPRPKLGSNGGETIRIGTSTWSMENSNTLVEGNYFERCNGETEIISVKSCENRIVGNTFWECEGSIVLRHGNRNEVSGNYLLGNGKAYTGGIRVINQGHKIVNNYLHGLMGTDFRAPLVIMNGVLHSPANRYHQVADVEIAFNTFIDCKLPWLFCVGSDAERTERPVNVRIVNNVVSSPGETELIRVFDKTDGLTLTGNVMLSAYGMEKGTGCLDDESALKRAIEAFERAVKDDDKTLAGSTNCGPGFTWRPAVQQGAVQAKTLRVSAGTDNLAKAVRQSAAGDIIELQDAVDYVNTKKMNISHRLTIRAKNGLATRPVIKVNDAASAVVALFELKSGADLRLEGIELCGSDPAMKPAKYAFVTSKEGNLNPYNLFIDRCAMYGFNVQDGGCIFKAQKTSFADTIRVAGSVVRDSFRGFSLADEKDDKGHYNVEYFILENTAFTNIGQWAVNFYRGGNDESTLGGFLMVNHCVFDNVGNQEGQLAIKQTGWVNCDIRNSLFANSPLGKGPIRLSGAHNRMTHCCIRHAGKVGVASGAISENITYGKTPLQGKATDGGTIGLIE